MTASATSLRLVSYSDLRLWREICAEAVNRFPAVRVHDFLHGVTTDEGCVAVSFARQLAAAAGMKAQIVDHLFRLGNYTERAIQNIQFHELAAGLKRRLGGT